MSAGLPTDDPWADRQEAMTDDQFTALLLRGLSFESIPGTRFAYSNLSFALLGRVIERAAVCPTATWSPADSWNRSASPPRRSTRRCARRARPRRAQSRLATVRRQRLGAAALFDSRSVLPHRRTVHHRPRPGILGALAVGRLRRRERGDARSRAVAGVAARAAAAAPLRARAGARIRAVTASACSSSSTRGKAPSSPTPAATPGFLRTCAGRRHRASASWRSRTPPVRGCPCRPLPHSTRCCEARPGSPEPAHLAPAHHVSGGSRPRGGDRFDRTLVRRGGRVAVLGERRARRQLRAPAGRDRGRGGRDRRVDRRDRACDEEAAARPRPIRSGSSPAAPAACGWKSCSPPRTRRGCRPSRLSRRP